MNAFRTFGSHLRACMAACRGCSQCAAFTPSGLTGKCHWSSTCMPLADGDAPVWHGGAIPTFSRDSPARHEGAVRTFIRPPDAAQRAIIDAPTGHCGGTDVHLYKPGRCAHETRGKGGWHLREMIGNLTETGPLAAAGLTPNIVARCAAARVLRARHAHSSQSAFTMTIAVGTLLASWRPSARHLAATARSKCLSRGGANQTASTTARPAARARADARAWGECEAQLARDAIAGRGAAATIAAHRHRHQERRHFLR
jgi:hypothetical protein